MKIHRSAGVDGATDCVVAYGGCEWLLARQVSYPTSGVTTTRQQLAARAAGSTARTAAGRRARLCELLQSAMLSAGWDQAERPGGCNHEGAAANRQQQPCWHFV